MKRHVWIAGSLFTIMILSAASMVWAPPKGDVWLMKHTPMPSQRVGFATSANEWVLPRVGKRREAPGKHAHREDASCHKRREREDLCYRWECSSVVG